MGFVATNGEIAKVSHVDERGRIYLNDGCHKRRLTHFQGHVLWDALLSALYLWLGIVSGSIA
jgi:hypothetical protein